MVSKPNDTTQYFPAITLFHNEYVTVNLGERPFKFPIPKAKPIIGNPTAVVSYFEQLQQKIVSLVDSKISLQTVVSFPYISIYIYIDCDLTILQYNVKDVLLV